MRFNNSRIQAYQRCPRFYYYRFVENLVPNREAVPLLVGRAVHRGLASHYSGAGRTEVGGQVSAAFDESRSQHTWLQAELQELQQQEAYAKQILLWYTEHYSSEAWTPLAPEVRGSVPMGSHTFFFQADGVVSWRGYPWVLETKTTSQLGPVFFRKFYRDAQPKLYMYAIGIHLGMQPKGVIINAIKKSRLLDRAEFAREVIMPTDSQMADCIAQTVRQANEIDNYTISGEKEGFLEHFGECIRYNRTCDYFELCQGDVVDFDALFKKREPDYTEVEEEQ